VKSYRSYTPTQSYLLPPSPTEWLAEGHLVYFVLDLVTDLDLGVIERVLQAKDARGERPYSPRMMTALLLYGYAVGVFSSRRIARATFEDVAFRVLAGGEHPHFTTVNEFRARHREALAGLFGQLLRECQSAGLVKLGHVAIDGTKMKANASKHKAMSYDRMNKETAAARAVELRRQADELRVKAEDPSRSPPKRAEAATLAKKRDQLALALDGEDRNPPSDDSDDDLPRNSPPSTPDGTPAPRAQRNFTDPDSRIMVRDGTFLQAYNAQIAVDEEHQIIVAAAMSNQGTDVEYFEPMLNRIVDNCDAVPERTTADSGYFSAANVHAAEHMGTEPFIAVGKHRNDGAPMALPALPHHQTTERLAMRARLDTAAGRRAYARRKQTVEPVFGQMRACRGFRQFSFRGLFKNRCEWLFVCLTHNLLKLFRAPTRRRPALAAG
jgi:transposase